MGLSTLRLLVNGQTGCRSRGEKVMSGGGRRVSFLRCVRNGSAWLHMVCYNILFYVCVSMCVGAMTTERTRPPVLHGSCHRHTHTYTMCILVYTLHSVCVYGHVRVLDDIIIM